MVCRYCTVCVACRYTVCGACRYRTVCIRKKETRPIWVWMAIGETLVNAFAIWKKECQLSWVRGVWSSWKSTGVGSQRTTALPLMSCATSCLAPVSIRFGVYGVLLWKRLCFVRLWRIQNKSGIAPSLMSWQCEEGRVPKSSTHLTLLQVE